MKFRILVGALALSCAACGASDQGTPEASSTGDAGRAAALDLPAYFDCVRESGGAVLSAHRGGPGVGLPENSIEAFEATLPFTPLLEVDVVESRDGVLYLLHDRSLGRTTTGSGQVVDTDWADVERLRLRDINRQVTDARVPTLADALAWAKANNAILQLDRKRMTSFRKILDAVRVAGAEQNVMIIAYRDEDAELIARLAPDVMVSAGVQDRRQLDRLQRNGVDPARIVAWTGTREPDAALWRMLSAAGVEPNFGTLGRPGERLDDVYAADGDFSEYEALVEMGLVVLATDLPREVAAAVSFDDVAASCRD